MDTEPLIVESDREEDTPREEDSPGQRGDHSVNGDNNDENQDEGNYNNDSQAVVHSAVLVMFASVCICLTLGFMAAIINTNKKEYDTVQVVLAVTNSIVTFTTVTICSLFIYVAYHRHGQRRVDVNEQVRIQIKFMLITLGVFGSGSFLRSVIGFYCLVGQNIKLSNTNNLDHLVVLAFQLFFFWEYGPKRVIDLSNNLKWHYAFAILMTVEIYMWLTATLKPLMVFGYQKDDFTSKFYFLHHTDNSSSVMCANYTLRDASDLQCKNPTGNFFVEFFDLFYVEFATVAISTLFYVWKTTMSLGAYNTNNTTPRPIQNQDEEELPFVTENQHQQQKILAIVISVTLSMIYSVILTVFSGIPDANYDNNVFQNVPVYVFPCIQIVYFLPFTMFLLFISLNKRNERISFRRPISVSEYTLIATAGADVIWYTFRGVSSFACCLSKNPSPYLIGTPSTATEISTIIWSVVAIFNTLIQTKFLIDIRRKRNRHIEITICHSSIPVNMNYVLIFTCTLNVAEWFVRGFMYGMSKVNVNPITAMVNALLGVDKSQIISLVLLPVMCLYRFHSAMVALELYWGKDT